VSLKLPQRNLLLATSAMRRMDDSGADVSALSIEQKWVVESPSTATVDETKFWRYDKYSLKITNVTPQPTIVRLTEEDVPQPYAGQPLVFSAMVYSDNATTVSCYLHNEYAPYTSVTPNTQELVAGSWNAVYSNENEFGQVTTAATDVSITLVIGATQSKVVWLTTPCLTLSRPENFNQITLNARQFLPDVIRDADSESSNPTRPFAKMFHSMSADMSRLIEMYLDMQPLSAAEVGHAGVLEETNPYKTLSAGTLFSVDNMLPEYIDYAGMFVGTRVKDNIYDGADGIHDTETFDFARWQLRTKAYGHKSGSRGAVKEAVKTVLSDRKAVLVTPNLNGNAFTIGIKTLTDETPTAQVAGDSSSEVLAAAEPARPAGFTFVHETVDSIPFVLDDTDFGVFDLSAIE